MSVFYLAGIAIGEHKSMGSSWVIIITDRFEERVIHNSQLFYFM